MKKKHFEDLTFNPLSERNQMYLISTVHYVYTRNESPHLGKSINREFSQMIVMR